MISSTTSNKIQPNSDCRIQFEKAYNNRYTWDPLFKGYFGKCSYQKGDIKNEGKFRLDLSLKPQVTLITDPNIKKAIQAQLWEVSIHRVRRSFDNVHQSNTFIGGATDEQGTEIIVGGKSKGDFYKIKDNIITKVYRNIHGQIIIINTFSVLDTGSGYLSERYSSQCLDPVSNEPLSNEQYYLDKFIPLNPNGPWVLSERTITKDKDNSQDFHAETFLFTDLSSLS